jgi:hypothetical protein
MLYYIAIHDAGRSALIAGPYPTEREAVSHMAHVQQLAEAADPWSWFYTYSLARSEVCYETSFGPATAQPAPTCRVDMPAKSRYG